MNIDSNIFDIDKYSNDVSVNQVFLIIFLSLCGSILAVWPVALIWQSMVLSNSELEQMEHIPYEDRYELENMDVNENKSKKENFIIENTPDGLIILRHNEDEEGFEYWSNKALDFIVLKTVARKYCLQFNLKNLYVDGYEEYLKQKEDFETFKEKELKRLKELEKKEEEEEDNDCVFVKPKISEINRKTQEREAKVDWRENKFIWKGKPSESPLTEKKKKEQNKFSFKDYKKMLEEKKKN